MKEEVIILNIEREDVACYLADVKQAVKDNRYTVAPREKNEQLFQDYVFNEQMREEILLGLCVEDFCGTVNNEHPRFLHEILYIFGKDIQLLPRYGGDERIVSIYIKFNKLENSYCIVISFNEQEHPLNYVFK